MKRAWGKSLAAVFAVSALAMLMLAEQPQPVLGKIDFAALYDAAPALPANTAEAGKRLYGSDIANNTTAADLTPFYDPFNKRVEAAWDAIKPAMESRSANQEAMGQRALANAESSPIIARMGGTEKMSQMSEEERQQAAMQAAAEYQQSMAGGRAETSGGMQAIMQRVMNDPEYRERFEKMTPEEQEAEMRKAMGPNARVAQHTAEEEQRAMQTPNQMAAAVARQNDLGALMQRVVEIETEFANKDKAISASAGNHDQIRRDMVAKIAKLPIVHIPGEASYDGPDPAGLKRLRQEQAGLDLKRAAAELQQRAALYAERKAKYKELAASYAAWLMRGPVASDNASVNLVSDSSADTALQCEEELIKLAEGLRRYHEDALRDAASYEQNFHRTMAEM